MADNQLRPGGLTPELSQGPDQTGATALPAVAWWRTDAARRWLGGVAVVLITLVSFWVALNPQWVSGLGHWGYIGAFVISLIASATIVLPAPGLAIVIAMGAALDPVLLGVVAGVGSALGELTGYIAGSTGRALIPEERTRQIDTLQRLTRKYGAVLLFVLAAIPFPLFDFAGIVAGMLKMRVWTFLIAVALGKSIKYIILILIGSGSLQMLQRWFG
jgi:membrane protein YqaA with SNARE-associated domain